MAGRVEGSSALQIAIDQAQGARPLSQAQINFIHTLFAPNQESSFFQSQAVSIPELVQHPAVRQLVGNLWETCVVQNNATPEESFALGMLASGLVYDTLPDELQEKIGNLKRARGSVASHYQDFNLCPDAESNMSKATHVDGIAFGVNDTGEKVAALKIYPGRKSVLVIQPVALDKGILVPGVLYEVSDKRTRDRIEHSLITNNATIPLREETEFAVMRPVKLLMREILAQELPTYMRRDMLREEIPFPIAGDNAFVTDRLDIARRTRHPDDIV